MSSRGRTLKVTIIEKNPLLREALATCLAELRAEVNIYGDPVDCEVSRVPDVILIECNEHHLSGVCQLRRAFPKARLVAINVDPEDIDLITCIGLRIEGFTLKEANASDLMKTIQAVADGQKVIPSPVANRLFELLHDGELIIGTLHVADLNRITLRERQVFDLVAKGFSNKEIAEKLSLATHTIKSHVHNVLKKLGLQNRIDLINYYWRQNQGNILRDQLGHNASDATEATNKPAQIAVGS